MLPWAVRERRCARASLVWCPPCDAPPAYDVLHHVGVGFYPCIVARVAPRLCFSRWCEGCQSKCGLVSLHASLRPRCNRGGVDVRHIPACILSGRLSDERSKVELSGEHASYWFVALLKAAIGDWFAVLMPQMDARIAGAARVLGSVWRASSVHVHVEEFVFCVFFDEDVAGFVFEQCLEVVGVRAVRQRVEQPVVEEVEEKVRHGVPGQRL